MDLMGCTVLDLTRSCLQDVIHQNLGGFDSFPSEPPRYHTSFYIESLNQKVNTLKFLISVQVINCHFQITSQLILQVVPWGTESRTFGDPSVCLVLLLGPALNLKFNQFSICFLGGEYLDLVVAAARGLATQVF